GVVADDGGDHVAPEVAEHVEAEREHADERSANGVLDHLPGTLSGGAASRGGRPSGSSQGASGRSSTGRSRITKGRATPSVTSGMCPYCERTYTMRARLASAGT